MRGRTRWLWTRQLHRPVGKIRYLVTTDNGIGSPMADGRNGSQRGGDSNYP